VVSIQSSYTFPWKCKCSSPSKNLIPCSPLTSYLFFRSCPSYGDVICGTFCFCSFNYLSYGNVICGTSCFCSFNYFSYGDVIYGTSIVYIVSCTIVSIADGSTLPFIILCAFTFVLSCSLFILKLEVPPLSILFFFLTTLLGEFAATFFLISSVVYISSLVLLTLVGGFCEFSFWCTNKYWKIFANTKANW